MRTKALVAIVTAALLAGCTEQMEPPFQRQNVVQGDASNIAQGGSTFVWVQVDTSVRVDTAVAGGEGTVTGASVTLIRSGETPFGPITDTTPLTETLTGTGYYYNTSFVLFPGDSYWLDITFPWGETAAAQTVMPDSFTITSPDDGDTVSLSDPLAPPLVWNTRGDSVFYIYLKLFSDTDTLEVDFDWFLRKDTTIVVPIFTLIGAFADSTLVPGWCTIQVSAIDQEPALTGAIGVFKAYWRDNRTLRIVP